MGGTPNLFPSAGQYFLLFTCFRILWSIHNLSGKIDG